MGGAWGEKHGDGSLASSLVIRYIHKNPVKAGLINETTDWKWSSCIGYYGEATYPPGLLDSELILGMFSEDRARAISGFKEFNEAKNDNKCLDNETTKRLTDDQARAEIKKTISAFEIAQIKSFPKSQRDEIISKVKKIEGLTQRQAARILGISPNLIFKTWGKHENRPHASPIIPKL